MIKIAMLAAVVLPPLAACAMPTEPTAVQSAESRSPGIAIKLTAKRVPYPKARFAEGSGPFSCVKATITNQTKGNVQVNPLYFAITDTGGEKRNAELGVAEGQFEVLTLAPGERASGVVCTTSRMSAKVLTFTDAIHAELARAQVI